MTVQTFAALASIALLASCGNNPTETPAPKAETAATATATASAATTSTTATSSSVETSTGQQAGQRSPSEFLPFAPAYPGATVKTRVASASSEEGSGSMIAMHTPDDFAKVVAFYDSKAKFAKGTAKMVSNDADSSIRIISDEASSTGALIAINRDVMTSGTSIVITSGTDKGASNAQAEAAKIAAATGNRLQ